jgi:hypothetical protein
MKGAMMIGTGRLPIVVASLALLAGCGSANVYDMTPDQAYAKLIPLEKGTPAVIVTSGVRESFHGTPGQSVTWATDGAHSYYECTAWLTPEGLGQTSVNVGCSDANAPAKFALAKALKSELVGSTFAPPNGDQHRRARNRYIELVDSTLSGRPFDHTRAKSQVMGWPDPPISAPR